MMANRLFLLALLPLIGLGLYWEGQSYDPALIRFDPNEAQSGAKLEFPDRMGGYQRIGTIRTYTKENLYEYINGHAEYFITAGFVGLSVGEYARTGSGTAAAAEVMVDMYEMGSALQAFGVFSDESGATASPVDIGIIASRTSQGINFNKGRYYVKISVFDDAAPVERFAREMQKGMQEDPEALALFARFPDLENPVTTRFVRRAYRGLDFISNVLEREYVRGSDRIHLFFVEGGEDEIAGAVAAFKEYFGVNEIPYKEEVRDGTTLYRVEDPYEGTWTMVPFPRVLYGVFGAVDDEVIGRIVGKGRSGGQG